MIKENNINLETIEPIWTENFTAIAANSSNEYVPYLSVYLESILKNTSDNRNYDIVILEQSITEENKEILNLKFQNKKNISLRFFNPSDLFNEETLNVTHKYLCKESYFRLSAPIIFNKYEKLIFTDVDLIFNNDPFELANIEMHDSPILAVLEPIWSRWINNDETISGVNIRNYTKERLKLTDPHHYFNTGVMLMDIKKLNDLNFSKNAIDKLSAKVKYLYQDQDVINEVLIDKIGVLPWSWNSEILGNTNVIEEAEEYFSEYCNYEKQNIIHWVGGNKPWIQPTRDKAYIWWSYARQTPYYETIISRMIRAQMGGQMSEAFKYRMTVLKYWKYKLLSNITFGRLKEHYVEKRIKWKNKIWLAKQLRG